MSNYYYYPPHMLRRTYVSAMRQGKIFNCGICEHPIYKNDKRGILTIDHIVPKSRGGSDEFDNLQAAHESCNMRKGSIEPVIEFKVWPPGKRPLSLQINIA